MMLRRAEPCDCEALARIYNQSISPDASVTAQLLRESVEERRTWMRGLQSPFGAWVCEDQSRGVVGWCSLVPFAVRPGLADIAELSVYVDVASRARMRAARLLCFVANEARRRGFRSLLSIVHAANRESLRGLSAYGFVRVATLHEVGRIGGQLGSAVWVEKDLRRDDPPRYRRLRDATLRGAGVARTCAQDETAG